MICSSIACNLHNSRTFGCSSQHYAQLSIN
uniref:Uncharacterized protein n=1 Tax=Arundo donax TaxID=35708 RepID=A0A0A9A097_ARUDO